MPNPTRLLHSTLGPTLLASPTASAGARLSLAAEEDPSVAEHGSVLGRGSMSPPFHRDPKIETGWSSLPSSGRKRGFQGELPGHHLSACSQLHLTPSPSLLLGAPKAEPPDNQAVMLLAAWNSTALIRTP